MSVCLGVMGLYSMLIVLFLCSLGCDDVEFCVNVISCLLLVVNVMMVEYSDVCDCDDCLFFVILIIWLVECV